MHVGILVINCICVWIRAVGIGEDDDGELREHWDEVWVRYSFASDEPWKKVKLVRQEEKNASEIGDAKFDLYNAPLALPRAKTRDLHKMCQVWPYSHILPFTRSWMIVCALPFLFALQWLPKQYHELYPDPDGMMEDSEYEDGVATSYSTSGGEDSDSEED